MKEHCRDLGETLKKDGPAVQRRSNCRIPGMGHSFTGRWSEFHVNSHSNGNCQEAFLLYDQRGDGKIPVSQIGDVMRALGQVLRTD